ncbi:MAG TPA: DNA topoisomerase IB [Xanthobacteraceae bacterium]|nr:DNA topoisomerase IB [Xanthobacteraceae bacterium]
MSASPKASDRADPGDAPLRPPAAAGELHRTTAEKLAIRRRRNGHDFCYVAANGVKLRDPVILRRLKSLAVPPAYEDVRYSGDPRAHLQAVGRDAAGRLQYRYHPQWEKVRERRKARRLLALVQGLPRVRREVTRRLSAREPSRDFALAAIIELVSLSAIRPGSESYARAHGTRGAATLLKSNVSVKGEVITLTFRAKGGQRLRREVRSSRLARAIAILRKLPGRRLFQYRDDTGAVRGVRRREVNEFLHAIAGVRISLKDFRTLMASLFVLQMLAGVAPAKSERRRRRQIIQAVRAAAAELANTPAVCRKSYVHDTVFAAFENGALFRLSVEIKSCRSAARRERLLARIVKTAVN